MSKDVEAADGLYKAFNDLKAEISKVIIVLEQY